MKGTWIVRELTHEEKTGEFFGRTVKAGSIRVEFEDLALAHVGLQVVTCQRVKKELVEGILESLCDTWRETLGRRQQRDMGRFLSDSLGAAPALGGEGGLRISGWYDQRTSFP